MVANKEISLKTLDMPWKMDSSIVKNTWLVVNWQKCAKTLWSLKQDASTIKSGLGSFSYNNAPGKIKEQ